jgi:hypothetical protein
MVGSISNSKKATQKQVDRVCKVVWETFKDSSIVAKYKDQEVAEVETFYTPLDSPNQFIDENEPSWLVGIGR